MSLGLYGLADHAVREALSRFGGLVVHALHADRGRFVPGLRGPVDHAVRGALPGLGGLVVHALHAVNMFCFYWLGSLLGFFWA